MNHDRQGQRQVTPSEFAAVDMIYAAYMGCNAAQREPDVDSPLCYETTTSPMAHIALAGKSALTLLCERVGMTQSDADDVWAEMVRSDCSTRDAYVAVRFSNY